MSQRRTGEVRTPLAVRVGSVTVGAVLVWLLMRALSEQVYPDAPPTVRHALNAVVIFVFAVPMVFLARRYLDRSSIRGLGLAGPRTGWWPLLAGALAWLIPGVGALLLCLGLGVAELTVNTSAGRIVATGLLLVALVFLFEAFPEELIFRGYLYVNLRSAMSTWLAVAVQAALFSAFGTALWVVTDGWGVVVDQAVLFFGFGLAIGAVRAITGSLWAAIGYHLAFQVVMQLLLGQHAPFEVAGADALVMVVGLAGFAGGPLMAWLLTGRRTTA